MKVYPLTVTIIAALFLGGCNFGSSITPQTEFDTYIGIPLGNDRNNFRIEKTLFLGHRVDSFRVRMRYSNPPINQRWPNSVILVLNPFNAPPDTFAATPATALGDNSFWTRTYTNTNKLDITIQSVNSFSNFQGGSPRFEILGIEVDLKQNHPREYVPTTDPSTDQENWLVIDPRKEVIAFLPGVSETHHYVIPNPNNHPIANLYVSPQLVELGNDVDIQIALSGTGFTPADDDQLWMRPRGQDTGIYHEFSSTFEPMYLTIKSLPATPYILSYSELVQFFSNIQMERDGNMGQAADIDIQDIIDNESNLFPHRRQIAYYLRSRATYDRRIRELMVMGSARLLDATEGQMRFNSADLFTSYDSFRDVDIQFQNTTGRAESGMYLNKLYLNDLDNPSTGSKTLVHEWGHWDFGLPDEYIDVTGPPPLDFSQATDPNSLMGAAFATNEFCDDLNHLWSQAVGGQRVESSWNLINLQYNLPNSTGPGLKPHFQGRYLDVLHKLDALFAMQVF